jgi:diguanylate cyclase (GGDEF)-like protein
MSTGEYASRVTQYEFVREFFTSNTLSVLIDTVFVFLFLLVIYMIAGWIMIIPAVAFVVAVTVGLFAQYRIGKRVAAAANESAQRQALLVETISTLETVKSLRAESNLLRRWQELSKHASRTSEQIKHISSAASNVAQFVQQLVTVGIILIGTYQFAEGNISMGSIIATVMLSGRAIAPLGQVTMTLARLRQAGEWAVAQPGKRMSLGIGARDLDFEFTALSFQDPGSVRFRYRLSGYDEDWRQLDVGFQRVAGYTNLPPGDYVFEVMAMNNAGVPSTAPAELAFEVPPYFTETMWFPALLGGMALMLFGSGYRFRVRQLRHRQRELEARIRDRTEELRITNNRLVEANRALRDASQTDPLTGLRNRRYLYGQMNRDIAHFERLRQRLAEDDPVVVFALLDVDHFKRINDEHGHGVGDQLLRQLAQRLERLVRAGDYVVRWGGEEFLIVFREMPRVHVEGIINRLIEGLTEDSYAIDVDTSVRMTCSAGFAEYPLDSSDAPGLSWEAMVDIADHALYEVKQAGRNGWGVLRPGTERDPLELLRIIRRDLRSAIDSGAVDSKVRILDPVKVQRPG